MINNILCKECGYIREWSEFSWGKNSCNACVILKRTRASAKLRNLEFDLEVEDIVIPSHCPALGVPLMYGYKGHNLNSPSVDRVDNNKGYIKGNIIIVSRKANTMKSNGTIDELIRLAHFYYTLENNLKKMKKSS